LPQDSTLYNKGGFIMIITDLVHVFAGAFILLSLALGTWIHPYWYFFTAFVGANLFQYGFSKFCPLAMILKKFGVPETREGKGCCTK